MYHILCFYLFLSLFLCSYYKILFVIGSPLHAKSRQRKKQVLLNRHSLFFVLEQGGTILLDVLLLVSLSINLLLMTSLILLYCTLSLHFITVYQYHYIYIILTVTLYITLFTTIIIFRIIIVFVFTVVTVHIIHVTISIIDGTKIPKKLFSLVI